MPRGYLRHKGRTAGRKASRGGSSKPATAGYTCGRYCRYGKHGKYQFNRPAPILEAELEDYYDDEIKLYADDEIDTRSALSLDDYQAVEHINEGWHDWEDESCSGELKEQTRENAVSVDVESVFSLCENAVNEEVSAASAFSSTTHVFDEQEDIDSSSFSLVDDGMDDDISRFVEVTRRPGNTASIDNEEDTSYVDVVNADVDTDDDFSCVTMQSTTTTPAVADAAETVCAICLEDKPLLQLMKKCSCHPSACRDCLHTHYIVNAQEKIITRNDISKMYPLRCFWPSCDRTLREVQISMLVRNPKEMDKYHELSIRAKIERDNRRRQQKEFERRMQQQRHEQHQIDAKIAHIKKYLLKYLKFTSEEVTSLMTALDISGDGIAVCPGCKALFVKDGGCTHMTCSLCHHEFSFTDMRDLIFDNAAPSNCEQQSDNTSKTS